MPLITGLCNITGISEYITLQARAQEQIEQGTYSQILMEWHETYQCGEIELFRSK